MNSFAGNIRTSAGPACCRACRLWRRLGYRLGSWFLRLKGAEPEYRPGLRRDGEEDSWSPIGAYDPG